VTIQHDIQYSGTWKTAHQPLVGQGLCDHNHSHTQQSTGLFWTGDQQDAETSV